MREMPTKPARANQTLLTELCLVCLKDCFMNEFDALEYHADSGSFTWRTHSKRSNIGKLAGNIHNRGYWRIRIHGKTYLAHRLVWFFEHGEFPDSFLDHINGNRLDNRIENLRQANYELNAQNKRVAYKNNKCGFLGVRWSVTSKAWMASIKHKGVRTHLGVFKTPEEASAAYIAAKRRLHEGCTI